MIQRDQGRQHTIDAVDLVIGRIAIGQGIAGKVGDAVAAVEIDPQRAKPGDAAHRDGHAGRAIATDAGDGTRCTVGAAQGEIARIDAGHGFAEGKRVGERGSVGVLAGSARNGQQGGRGGIGHVGGEVVAAVVGYAGKGVACRIGDGRGCDLHRVLGRLCEITERIEGERHARNRCRATAAANAGRDIEGLHRGIGGNIDQGDGAGTRANVFAEFQRQIGGRRQPRAVVGRSGIDGIQRGSDGINQYPSGSRGGEAKTAHGIAGRIADSCAVEAESGCRNDTVGIQIAADDGITEGSGGTVANAADQIRLHGATGTQGQCNGRSTATDGDRLAKGGGEIKLTADLVGGIHRSADRLHGGWSNVLACRTQTSYI